jgi:hypothetical protein
MSFFQNIFQNKKQKNGISAIDVQVVGVYAVKNIHHVYLIELEIGLLPSEVRVESFSQKNDAQSQSSWQAAYDEHYLDETGTKVIGRMLGNQNLPGTDTRIAFFLHDINFSKPLLWQNGEILLPLPSPMPDRLANILVYEPVD